MTTRSFLKSLPLLLGGLFVRPAKTIASELPKVQQFEGINTAFDVETANRWLKEGWKLVGVQTINMGDGERPMYLMGRPKGVKLK